MPQGRDFLFAIQDDKFLFYKVDSKGVVSKSAQPYFLNFAPVGWQDIVIKNVRNKNYWGVDRSVSNSLSFVEDGAAILKYIFYNLGVEEPAYFSIASQRLDYDTISPTTINYTSGGSPLTSGSLNEGTITGVPGATIYVSFQSNNPTDFLYGFIGTPPPSQSGLPQALYSNYQSGIYKITVPDNGVIPFSFTFYGGGTATIACTNAEGTTTSAYGYWYKQIFRSQMDLTSFVHTGSKVVCTCLEDGLPKYLKANENTVFEFPLEVSDAIFVKMDGVNLHDSLNYKIVSDFEITNTSYGTNIFLPLPFINNEGDSVGILEESQTIQNVSGLDWNTKLSQANFLLQNIGTKPITINISGTIEFTCTSMISAPAFAFKARFLTSLMDIANQNIYTIINTPSMVVGQKYSVPFSVNVSLAVNEKLFLEGIFFGGTGTKVGITFSDNNNYKIVLLTRYDPTYIRALRAQYLFEQLMNKVTDGNLKAAISPYFDQYKNIVFTSGNGIRGLYNVSTTDPVTGIVTVNNASMKISFADFYKFWNAFDSVGIQLIAGAILFDRKQNLIDWNNIIDLPETVSQSLKVALDKSFLFNEIHFGYPAISSDVGVLNANSETNDTMIFSLGTTSSPATVDKTSPVKAMPYEIEKIRVTQVDLTTTGFPTDNDNYVLAIENTLQPANGDIPAYYNLDRSLNASATGILDAATIFNLALSPKRMLLNNGAFIRSCLYRSDSKVLKFISSDKNNKLVCGGIVENADVTIGNLDEPFFFPVTFDFGINVPDDMEDLLEANPLQLFRFPFEGTMYVGIVNTVSYAPSSKAIQTFQLLSVPANQLQNLIDYYG